MFRPPIVHRKKTDFFLWNNVHVPMESSSEQSQPKTRIDVVLTEFCSKSSIHGISYFTDRDRHWIERLWWIIAFTLSVYLCLSSILSTWTKWSENLVVVRFNNKPMSIGEIPFPAVTICPTTKTSAKQFNYTDVYRSMFKLDGNKSRNITEKELKQIQVVSQLCDERIAFDVFDLFSSNFTDDSILREIENLAPTFEETLFLCKLFDRWSSCEELLFPKMTEEGFCYTFNALNANESSTEEMAPDLLNESYSRPFSNWDIGQGYVNPRNAELYPYRVFGTGREARFTVLLRVINRDIDYLCSGAVQGFKVAFHPPNEGPQILKSYFQISPGKTAIFTINPRLIISSPNIRKYDPDVRLCYFEEERHLRFYKQYTQRNCEVECLANFTLSHCGCVRFSMPRSRDTKICSSAKIDCCAKADNDIFRSGFFYDCNCLPACTSISYDAASTQAEFDLVSSYSKSRFQPDFNFENSTFSRLIISFKEELFVPSKRSEYHNLTDFLANSGGLCSLFVGASLLSFIELVYYFTLRMFISKRKQHQINQMNRAILPTFNSHNHTIDQLAPNGSTHIFTFLP